MGRVTVRRPVLTLSDHGERHRQDTLAVEEPLELRVGGQALAVTMRTPGHDVELAAGMVAPDVGVERAFFTTSSCGVCGKASLDAVRQRTRFSPADDPATVTPATLATLPEALRAAQRVFTATGGLHAAGLFTTGGALLVAREDVGRHNAVDKALGWALLAQRVPATGAILMVSGRASFELVQKAVMAEVTMLAAED